MAPPKDIPKRTEDVNAGIVIPKFDASPYDILEESYDPLSGLMYDEKKGIFMSLSTPTDDFDAHKLTFYHKKFGFTTTSAYKVWMLFSGKKKPQKMENFFFHPFEPTKPKLIHETIEIADAWVKFFDSLGWPRDIKSPYYPYGKLPETGSWPYMMWESEGFRLTLSIEVNDWPYVKNGPKYCIIITFDSSPLPFN